MTTENTTPTPAPVTSSVETTVEADVSSGWTKVKAFVAKYGWVGALVLGAVVGHKI